ncbi:MAG: EAL domain-containing protein [Sedimentibacter sp.]
MQNIPKLFSFMFFIAFIIYIIFGIYVMAINNKLKLNRIFFAVCISLSLWACGFAFSIAAINTETYVFWHRISALGWCSIYGIMLHFALILTESRVLKCKWIYTIIYLPAIVFTYAFAISSSIVKVEYTYLNTIYGLINIPTNNLWDKLFHLYYFIYMVTFIFLIVQWGKKSSVKNIKKQSRLITYSVVLAFFVGTLTDVLANAYLPIVLPQIAPIIILIPISAMLYSIRYYGLMNRKIISKEESVLNYGTRKQVYNIIISFLIFCGLLNIVLKYYVKDIEILPVLISSCFFFVPALIMHITNKFKLEEYAKNDIILMFVCLLIPINTIVFVEYESLIIWTFPFLFIIIFILFNERKMLIGLSISILLTQLMVSIAKPNGNITIESSYYSIRIILTFIAIVLAFYVNKIYRFRLKENADQIYVQKLIAEISSEFLAINSLNVDEKLQVMLKKVGKFFGAERTTVSLLDVEKNAIATTYEWLDKEIALETGTVKDTTKKLSSWQMNQIKSNIPVYIRTLEEQSEGACEKKQTILHKKSARMINIPFRYNGSVQGVLGIESLRPLKNLSDNNESTLEIISNLLADYLMKIESEKKQNHLTYYDQLTGLPNSILFRDKVNYAINQAKYFNENIGILYLDIDFFKTVNDTKGHEGGDELLKIIAEKLLECYHKFDTVARFSGDEFLILLNNISKEDDVNEITRNIMTMFKSPFIIKGQEFFVTASAGIAVYPVDGNNTDALIKNADLALRIAKDKGKNQCLLCSSNMKNEGLKVMELSNSLYRALEKNELLLYYQPQINIKTGEIAGLEALLRWDSPKFGMVSPAVFIPIAEKTGLINHIGEWVIKTACIQNKAWQDMGLNPVRMAVNLSFIQFQNVKLVDVIESILKETGMNPKYLEIEVTESIAVKETAYVVGVLNQLKRLGATISIDDFGTEYSSLSRLKMLPIDRIKMDIEFVRGIDGTARDQAFAEVIVDLTKKIGLKLIAEGVETETQLEFLRERMCDEVQGFYYFKPMPAKDVEKIL